VATTVKRLLAKLRMIGIVAWPPFIAATISYSLKGGQVTKPIMVVSIAF